MYREMVKELEEMIKNATSIDELEAFSNCVLAGLEKTAELEIQNNIDKLEKQAVDADKVLAGLTGAGTIAGAAGLGLLGAKLHRKIPAWKATRSRNKALAANTRIGILQGEERAHLEEYRKNMDKAMKGNLGASYSPSKGGERGYGGYGEYGKYNEGQRGYRDRGKSMRDPGNRVSTTIDGEARPLTDVSEDVKTLKTKDWLVKNKYPLLAGGGAAAVISKQQLDKSKKDAELQGAYRSGRGR